MAVLTDAQKVETQRLLESLAQDRGYSIDYVKSSVSAAVQALEDEYETNVRTQFSTAIETAAPGIFTNPQKKVIGKAWLKIKFGLE